MTTETCFTVNNENWAELLAVRGLAITPAGVSIPEEQPKREAWFGTHISEALRVLQGRE